MSSKANQLPLDITTRVTCPKCEHEFSLEQGFAKKALESLEAASRDARIVDSMCVMGDGAHVNIGLSPTRRHDSGECLGE
ncbi:MAG: hypothetical protein K1X67_16030 [Fimbriimonadaceae bacterium]|nr:hypothetical protein [Fimbriimonadaceae bacterium]